MTQETERSAATDQSQERLRTFHRRADRQVVPSPEERTIASPESAWNDSSLPSLPSPNNEFWSFPPVNQPVTSAVRSTVSLIHGNSGYTDSPNTRTSPTEWASPQPLISYQQSHHQVPVYSSTGLPTALIRAPERRQLRNPIWTLASYAEQLNYPLSEEWAPSLGRRCADLRGDFRSIPRTEYYFLPPPTQGFLGTSTIIGADLGLFIENSSLPVNSGRVVGEYWGPSTANGGFPLTYCDPNPNLDDPPNARADGAYLLRNDTYLVDAHEDCAVGYINDPFEEANCFFQIDPTNEHRLLVVARVTFPSNGVYEIFVNYGWQYWAERLHLLSPDAQRRCLNFYLHRNAN